jgi:hypothetical protein
MWHEVYNFIQKGLTNFIFDEHIQVTPNNQLFWATIIVHDLISNFYFS